MRKARKGIGTGRRGVKRKGVERDRRKETKGIGNGRREGIGKGR